MFTRFSKPILATFALLAAPAVLPAEVLELRSGGTLVGDVRLEGPDKIVVDARFPEARTVTLSRDELTPASLYSILERRADPKDAAKHRELGELAARLDLKGVAVADYRAVKQLDPSSAKEMDERIARLCEGIASDLLDDATRELEDGNSRAAMMYLHTILERYPDTRAAKGARELMPKAHEMAGPGTEVAPRTASATAAPKEIDTVAAHLQKGDKAFQPLRGHEGSSVASQHAAEQAISHYERAWEAAKRLPVAAGSPELESRIDVIRARAKQSLVDAYLTAGSIHLQRRSIPSAERYCNKACQLDPENKRNHELHRQIVDAKSVSSGTGGVGVVPMPR